MQKLLQNTNKFRMMYANGTVTEWNLDDPLLRPRPPSPITPEHQNVAVIGPDTAAENADLLGYLTRNSRINLQIIWGLTDSEFVPAADEIYNLRGNVKFLQGLLYGIMDSGSYSWLINELKQHRVWRTLNELPKQREIVRIY